MGKYTKLMRERGLEPVKKDSEWQARIDAFKDGRHIAVTAVCSLIVENKRSFKTLDKTKLVVLWQATRDCKKEHEAAIRELNVVEEALGQLVLNHMEDEGIDKFGAAGATFWIGDEPYASVEDKVKVREWFERNGMRDCLGVNYQTLSAIVKERLVEGAEMPEGVKVYVKSQLRATGARKGQGDGESTDQQ